MFRIVLCYALGVFLSSVSATQAADISFKDPPVSEVPAPVSWSGPYVGISLGGAQGDTDITDIFDYNGDPKAENSISASGFTGGAQLGYNFQTGAFVYGVEAGIGYIDLSGSKTAELPNPTGDSLNDISATYSVSGDLYGDLTARVGYAVDNLLVYVKGGAAVTNADFKAHYDGANCVTTGICKGPAGPSTFDFANSETLWGWTAGFGVEYALTNAVSLKAQYQHFDFGGASSKYAGDYSFPCSGGGWEGTCVSRLFGETGVSTTVDTVTVGVSYRFNP
ncbi:MAG: outer membrane beta-barrel protein [Hyphomicrobiales bacterium]|nr:outer membrane beta-barrel protein [Hyphomicrobiales bacterium]